MTEERVLSPGNLMCVIGPDRFLNLPAKKAGVPDRGAIEDGFGLAARDTPALPTLQSQSAKSRLCERALTISIGLKAATVSL
jgi:hypothetical protein